MIKKLSCILLTLLLLFTFSSHTTYAAQKQNNSSFFSFLENSLVAFIALNAHKNQVLAAQTQPTATPTLIPPTPLPTSQPTPQPTQQPAQQTPSLSDVSTYLLNGVNEYRSSLGLSSVQASSQTCSFAATRAQEIANGFTHDGFNKRVADHTLPYSGWSRATENIAEAPDYKEVVTLWKNSAEHAANMRDNTPYVCIEQSGSYYAYEGMRP